MEPPPGVENGTWVYHVRDTRPTPYVLQLERKVDALTGTVEELTGTVQELREVVQTMYTVLVADGLIPSNPDGEVPNSPEGRAEDVPESESRITVKRDEDGQEVPLLNMKQEVESEGDMEIDEDCEPNMTGGSSPATYYYRPPMSRRSAKWVSCINEDGSSSSPSPPPVKTAKRGRGRSKMQSSSATPQVCQCVTCDEIFPYNKVLSRHCRSSDPAMASGV
ncbi:hypothetical protein Ocin01_16842 [Orchesella cincta]|uniref:Uncharacterized protein n=1 Tax=Orchesella cincta TaxID=48709 RepID=A0A1D2MA79_ORCCI|nr:hypothetical protein Ocin01_16842 [Orchesella cincta]